MKEQASNPHILIKYETDEIFNGIRCEVNSGNETLYGGFNPRIDGSFNQADHAGVTGLTTGFGFDRSALKAETVCLIEALFT